jgi:hypothetical protein
MILTVLPVLLCATDAVDMQQSLITAHRQLHLEAHTRDHEVPVPPTTGGALPGIKMDCSMMQGGGDVIKTPGLFNFLELPSELRIQVCFGSLPYPPSNPSPRITNLGASSHDSDHPSPVVC